MFFLKKTKQLNFYVSIVNYVVGRYLCEISYKAVKADCPLNGIHIEIASFVYLVS